MFCRKLLPEFCCLVLLGTVWVCGCAPSAAREPAGNVAIAAPAQPSDGRYLCDDVMAALLRHSIETCDRELGPSGTDKELKWVFWDIERDLRGVQALMDATFAAEALKHPRAHQDLFLCDLIAMAVRTCKSQDHVETTTEDRRNALRGIREVLISTRKLLQVHYSVGGLKWPDDSADVSPEAAPLLSGARRAP